jgi:hypothetical protein
MAASEQPSQSRVAGIKTCRIRVENCSSEIAYINPLSFALTKMDRVVIHGIGRIASLLEALFG